PVRVVEEFAGVDVGTFDMRGGSLGDRQEFLDARPRASLFEPGQPLPQRLGDDAGHRLAGRARDLLRKSMGLRILDVETHGLLPIADFVYLSTSLFARRLRFEVRFQPLRGRRPRTGGRAAASTNRRDALFD